MNLVRCNYGHFYDSDKYPYCPHCSHSDTNPTVVDSRLRSYEPIGGKWIFDSLIGAGSFGKVYKAVNVNDPDDTAALKVISIDKSGSTDSWSEDIDPERTVLFYDDNVSQEDVYHRKIKKVENEIELLHSLSGCEYLVNACADYRFEREDGEAVDLVIEMELLTPITDYFKENEFSEAELLKIAVHICEALIYLHEKGIIHSDIKPENVYRSKAGIYKLGDFSVAGKAGEISSGGTIPYCAPELLSTGILSDRTDIYALGVSLYVLAGGGINKVMDLLPGESLPQPVGISSEFSGIIMEACASDPEKRINNASGLLEKLKKIHTVSAESIPFTQGISQTPTLGRDKNSSADFFMGSISFTGRNMDGKTNGGEKQSKDRDKVDKLTYNIAVWVLFTCIFALLPLGIFWLFRSCFRPDFPYMNKTITELLYFGLTLSIINIKELFSLGLWRKERAAYVIILFLSLLTLILTAVFFGIMTANDMSILNGANFDYSSLLNITIAMGGASFCIGIFIQCLGVYGGEKRP